MNLKLTQGKVAIIDKKDSHLEKFKWLVTQTGKDYYAARSIKLPQGRRLVFLHHAIMGFPLKHCVIDHINGCTLDNRRKNLRIVTIAENSCNQERKRNGITSSKFAGVSLHKTTYKNKVYCYWQAQMWVGKYHKRIGLFKTEKEAAIAYQLAQKDKNCAVKN